MSYTHMHIITIQKKYELHSYAYYNYTEKNKNLERTFDFTNTTEILPHFCSV